MRRCREKAGDHARIRAAFGAVGGVEPGGPGFQLFAAGMSSLLLRSQLALGMIEQAEIGQREGALLPANGRLDLRQRPCVQSGDDLVGAVATRFIPEGVKPGPVIGAEMSAP